MNFRLTCGAVSLAVALLCAGCTRKYYTARYTITSSIAHDKADITYTDEHEQKVPVKNVSLPFSKDISVRDEEMLVLSCQGHNPEAKYHGVIATGEKSDALSPIGGLDGTGTDPFVCTAETGQPPIQKGDVRLQKNLPN